MTEISIELVEERLRGSPPPAEQAGANFSGKVIFIDSLNETSTKLVVI
jgi:hypothetical protein